MHVVGTNLLDHPGRDPRIEVGWDLVKLREVPPGITFTNPPFARPSTVAELLLAAVPHCLIELLMQALWLSGKNDGRRKRLLRGRRLHAIIHLSARPRWVERNLSTDRKRGFVLVMWRPMDHLKIRPIGCWHQPKEENGERRRKLDTRWTWPAGNSNRPISDIETRSNAHR
jgi:hypothetical protein